jgi:hypothetical protein
MDSAKLSNIVLIAVGLLIAVLMGFWLGGFWRPNLTSTYKPPVVQEVKPGWCCKTAGAKCVYEAQGGIYCLRNDKGLAYNATQTGCDTSCLRIPAKK